MKIHITHATDLELNTRAFAWPCATYHSFQLEEQRNVPTFCSKSALRFKKVPLTTDVKISLRARFCSPAIKYTGHPGRQFLAASPLVFAALPLFVFTFKLLKPPSYAGYVVDESIRLLEISTHA